MDLKMKKKMNEEENENNWDKLLQIKTTGRDDTDSDTYRYPYEPTPYCVLERLANSGLLRKGNTLIDYGCGKGRVDFFLSYQTRCKSIGIEYNKRIFARASENKETAVSGVRTSFECVDACKYQVPENVDRIYFFNPFSIEILKEVMARILESYYSSMRQIKLLFYYPSDEYISYLMGVDELVFDDEIDCMDLFEGNNQREKIVIFETV